jgi:hypothetical protein
MSLATQFAIVLCATLAVFAARPTRAQAQQEEKFVDVPVTKAMLFSSGVGYFEHTGSVEGEGLVRLMFKTNQINDVLKSMVLTDLDGGTITSVTYASNDPVDRALHSFGIDISGEPTLADILRQLRGAEVVVDGVTGKILGVEEEEKIVGNPPTKIVEQVLRLVTEKGIQTVRLSATTTLLFTDKKMQAELNEALALLIGAKDTDRKPVDIRFVGKGKRTVKIGYLVESPVWKTSYRLDLGAEKPLLQGWAIVENTSDNDWKNVSLSLISGRPISFIQDLYTPLYMDRPVVQPELFASLKPRLYEEGIESEKALKRLGEARDFDGLATQRNRKAAAGAAPGAPMADAVYREKGEAAKAAGDDRFDMGGSVHAVASGSNVGELFKFAIQHPVSMQRRRSAMLPIVNQPVKAEKVSIYNPSQHATIPLNGVYLTNDTANKLIGGPVTVFDGGKEGGTYAGDARIGHMAIGEKRLLAYAMDLAVTIDPSSSSTTKITAAKLVRGVLHITRMTTITQTYTIKNKADAKRSLIIEYPFVNGRTLVTPKTFEEKTPAMYRFRVPIDAATTGEFVVQEQQPGAQQFAILGSSPNSYLGFINEGNVSDEVKKALQKAAGLQNELSQLDSTVNNLTQQKATIEQGQDRLRKNIETAGRDTQLGKRYLEKLNAEEDAIEKLNTQIEDARKKAEAKRKELADYLNGLNL